MAPEAAMIQQGFGESTALVIVDMLNDFVLEGAPLRVEAAQQLIPAISRGRDAARRAGSPVFYLCDAHRPDDPEFQAWPRHAVAGTPGAQVIDQLRPAEEDVVIRKRRFSGFFGTDLDLHLRERRIGRLVICGVLTDICVYHTAADAAQLAYRVAVATNATAAATSEQHAFALKQMVRLFGAQMLEL
jgi:nicotinamidase-related amidase